MQRIIETPQDLKRLLAFIGKQEPPFTVSIKQGGKRSIKQNRLIHMWMGEIYEQLGGTFQSVEYVRGYCKLRFGVPILRDADEHFRAEYDRVIMPYPYARKIEFMMEPISVPVTSRMNTKQLTEYLDAIHQHFSEQGVELTIPQDNSVGWQPAPPIEAYEDDARARA